MTLSFKQQALLREGVRWQVLPANTACPVGCEFCYESRMARLFDGLEVDYLPRYGEEAFEFFFDRAARPGRGPVGIGAVWLPYDGRLHYSPTCDAFSLGLSQDQIRRLLRYNQEQLAEGGWQKTSAMRWYTTGWKADPELIAELSRTFPDSFRIWLSVITFDDHRKRQVVRNATYRQQLLQILEAARSPVVYLLHFDEAQTMEDLAVIDGLRRPDISVLLQEMHHNLWHRERIKALSRRSNDFSLARVAVHLTSQPTPFVDLPLDRVRLCGPPPAYAWSERERLAELLAPYEPGADDIVLCSKAALSTLEEVLGGRARAFAVADRLRGSTTFATTVGSRDVAAKLREIRESGIHPQRVFLPSSFWTLRGRDFFGDSRHELTREFPETSFVEVSVPQSMLSKTVDCQTVAAWARHEGLL